jgi:hypothetical protein
LRFGESLAVFSRIQKVGYLIGFKANYGLLVQLWKVQKGRRVRFQFAFFVEIFEKGTER